MVLDMILALIYIFLRSHYLALFNCSSVRSFGWTCQLWDKQDLSRVHRKGSRRRRWQYALSVEFWPTTVLVSPSGVRLCLALVCSNQNFNILCWPTFLWLKGVGAGACREMTSLSQMLHLSLSPHLKSLQAHPILRPQEYNKCLFYAYI